MKNCLRPAVLLPLGAAATLLTTAARAQETPFYVKLDAGGTWMENTDLKEFFGENTTGARVKFDPGARVGFKAGMLLTDWFATELETGAMVNNIRSISGPSSVDAALWNVPFLINARFQIPKRMIVTPYFGGGLGFSESVLDSDHIDFGLTHVEGSQSDTVFAYQAFVGLRCMLSDHAGLSLEYHYFGTTDPVWKTDFRSPYFFDRMSFGGAETHAFSLALDFRF